MAVILFQLAMFIISGMILSKRVSIYLFAFLVVQLSKHSSYHYTLPVVLFTVFEFIRKPWDGKELEIERVQHMQENNILDSISSDDDNSPRDDETTVVLANALTRQQNNQRRDKKRFLINAYANPIEQFFRDKEVYELSYEQVLERNRPNESQKALLIDMPFEQIPEEPMESSKLYTQTSQMNREALQGIDMKRVTQGSGSSSSGGRKNIGIRGEREQ